jgi:glycosyltransferase involved in cell wall biosynthesis
MKLGINLINCGLGNNGGSRTLIKCAEIIDTFKEHTCELISPIDNFTWFKHKQPIKSIPSDLDALIASSCRSVKSTLSSNIKKKAWYIRGHETWSMSEQSLIKLYKNQDVINIVNSIGLQKLLESYGAESKVVYQGIDFHWWTDMNIRNKNKKIRIGCLFSNKSSKNWSEFKEVVKRLGTEKYEYVGMGADKCKDEFLNDFIHNASREQLVNLYSSCDIWFAPTKSEGLHNVPMEANLCGCLIVCSNRPTNGMLFDYAFKGNTAMIYENIDEAVDMIKTPNWSYVKNMQDHLKTSINTREYNMKKMIKILGDNYEN